jgi:hypothetical protein
VLCIAHAPSALLAIADEVIDEAARLRCLANDCVCDAAFCGASAEKRTKRITLLASVTKVSNMRADKTWLYRAFFEELNRQ